MTFISSLIYLAIAFILGIILVGFSLDIVSFQEIEKFLTYLHNLDPFYQTALGWFGVFLILSVVNYVRRVITSPHREKVIVLQEKEGDIKISLNAIEDMIKKSISHRKEISHIRPKVNITRRGMTVNIKAILTSEVNLSDFISEIQSEVKNKLSHLVGDGDIKVDLEIKKINIAEKKELEKKEEEPQVPFRNY